MNAKRMEPHKLESIETSEAGESHCCDELRQPRWCGRSTCLSEDLHLAENGAEESTPANVASPRLDEQVPAHVRPHALHDDLRGEEGVVEAVDVVAHVTAGVGLVVVVVLLLNLVVHVDDQLVQVVHVLPE